MKSTKKSLLASGLALLASVALLAGTTFAWFTDSVTNSGNRIQAGSLKINAYAFDLAADGTDSFTIEGVNGGEAFAFEATPQDLKKDTSPIINDKLFEPGKSNAKLLKVENAGTLAAKIKLDFTVNDGGLMDALWFDFVRVEKGEVKGEFTRRPMNELETIADGLELPLLKDENVQFILVYGMDESAGNTFMNKTFTADVTILAAQYTEEKDGFGNDRYDAAAEWPVDPDKEAVENGNVVKIGDAYYKDIQDAIDAAEEDETITLLCDVRSDSTITIDEKLTLSLDLNGKELRIASTDGTNGDGIVNNGLLRKLTNGRLVVESSSFNCNGLVNNGIIGELNAEIVSWNGNAVDNRNTIAQISGGRYIAHPEAYGNSTFNSSALYIWGNGKVESITGGYFQGAKAAVSNAGTITSIQGGFFDCPYIDADGKSNAYDAAGLLLTYTGTGGLGSISGGTWYCLPDNPGANKAVAPGCTVQESEICMMTSYKTHQNGVWTDDATGAAYSYYTVNAE